MSWRVCLPHRSGAVDKPATTIGQEGRPANQARTVLLAAAGREPSDQATVWGHGTADRCPGGGDGVDGGRWAQRNQGDQSVRAGEVFVECIENTGFHGFGLCGQCDNPALATSHRHVHWDRRRLPEERMQLAGSKDGGSVYTESDREVQNGNSG